MDKRIGICACCQKEFIRTGRGDNHKLYCSPSCADQGRVLRQKKYRDKKKNRYVVKSLAIEPIKMEVKIEFPDWVKPQRG